MFKHTIAALVTAASLVMPVAAWAENHSDADTVVATVNGTDITLGHMIAMHTQLPDQYRQLPPATLFKGILDQLVDQVILEQQGDGEETKTMQLMLENQRRGMMAARTMSALINDELTDEAIQAFYDREYAQVSETEWNASHILVDTEEAAKALVDELNAGADFAALAREKSTGPSGPNGGQLGWFGAGQMVPAFEAAVAEMAPETVSAPVQTQFGWHVIRLNEKRDRAAPPLEQVQANIRDQLRAEIVDRALTEARKSAQIERPGDTMDPALLNQPGILED